MLLLREPGQSRIESADLERRVDSFRRGDWPSLLRAACSSTPARPARAPARKRSREALAAVLVHLGGLSAESRALTAQPLADMNAALAELRDPRRRPQTRVAPLSPEVLNHVPAASCPLPHAQLLANLRAADAARLRALKHNE